jgi:hypothetical protein
LGKSLPERAIWISTSYFGCPEKLGIFKRAILGILTADPKNSNDLVYSRKSAIFNKGYAYET